MWFRNNSNLPLCELFLHFPMQNLTKIDSDLLEYWNMRDKANRFRSWSPKTEFRKTIPNGWDTFLWLGFWVLPRIWRTLLRRRLWIGCVQSGLLSLYLSFLEVTAHVIIHMHPVFPPKKTHWSTASQSHRSCFSNSAKAVLWHLHELTFRWEWSWPSGSTRKE